MAQSHRSSSTIARHRRRGGFTLIEAIVVVVILGILAAVIAPRLTSRISDSRTQTAESNATALAQAMERFRIDHGAKIGGSQLSIDVLWERPGFVDAADWEPYVRNADELLDPWGNKYILVMPGEKNRYDFDIVSYGADGKPGGEGENQDIRKP
jgi:general secretion pathway protein G